MAEKQLKKVQRDLKRLSNESTESDEADDDGVRAMKIERLLETKSTVESILYELKGRAATPFPLGLWSGA